MRLLKALLISTLMWTTMRLFQRYVDTRAVVNRLGLDPASLLVLLQRWLHVFPSVHFVVLLGIMVPMIVACFMLFVLEEVGLGSVEVDVAQVNVQVLYFLALAADVVALALFRLQLRLIEQLQLLEDELRGAAGRVAAAAVRLAVLLEAWADALVVRSRGCVVAFSMVVRGVDLAPRRPLSFGVCLRGPPRVGYRFGTYPGKVRGVLTL